MLSTCALTERYTTVPLLFNSPSCCSRQPVCSHAPTAARQPADRTQLSDMCSQTRWLEVSYTSVMAADTTNQSSQAPSSEDTSGQVTRLLRDYAAGDQAAMSTAIPIVYQELKRIARSQLQRSGVGQHLQTTALVHEAYVKLTVGQTQTYQNRRHFLAVASRAMRQIVVDAYRSQCAVKRGGDQEPVPLVDSDLVDAKNPVLMMQFGEAVDTLAKQDASLAEVLDLSCFAGLDNKEIAELTESTVRTVQRKLARAKAWIDFMLDPDASSDNPDM